jgi:alcohol oxidase
VCSGFNQRRKLSDPLFVAHVKRWLDDGKGLMASKSVSDFCFSLVLLTAMNSGGESGIKMRPTEEELLSMSPEFDSRWSTYFANAPDKPVMQVTSFASWVHSIFH